MTAADQTESRAVAERWCGYEPGEVREFYDDASYFLDCGDYENWLELFAPEAPYLAIARENHERGLPLATIRCDSRDMLADRVDAIEHTQFYARRIVRHFTSAIRPSGTTPQGALRCTANFLVVETLVDEGSMVHSVGEYLDELVARDGRLRFLSRVAVYDAPLVPTSLVIPL
ncbi:hypothetical protein BH23ACT3_BH23ACT3_03770 [soil metagenome]